MSYYTAYYMLYDIGPARGRRGVRRGWRTCIFAHVYTFIHMTHTYIIYIERERDY